MDQEPKNEEKVKDDSIQIFESEKKKPAKQTKKRKRTEFENSNPVEGDQKLSRKKLKLTSKIRI